MVTGWSSRRRPACLAGLVTLLLLPGLTLAGQQECPSFDCSLGSYFNGKFVERDNPEEDAADEDDGVLSTFYFDSGDFSTTFPDIARHHLLKGHLRDAHVACALACQLRYNTDAKAWGQPVASYWMFENTCDEGIGGVCKCFPADECAPSTQWWSDEYVEGWEYGDYFKVPATYSTGKLCDGQVVGDPHFTGADGSHFEFSGVPNHTFALISDSHLQVNAYLGGRYGLWGNRIKALTWIRKVAVMWGHHIAVFTARQGSDASYNNGYMASITVDGQEVEVQPRGNANAADGEFSASWTGVKSRSGWDYVDEYHVSVGDSLAIRLVLRPEVRNLRTKEDAVIHFTIDVESAHLSSNVHGVLGQTFRPDFTGRLGHQNLVHSSQLGQEVVPGDNAEGFIDGVVKDYLVKDFLKADCRFCRFARGDGVDEETSQAIAMSTAGYGSTSRKLLEAAR